MPVAGVDTPCLLVDLHALADFPQMHGVRLRPRAQSHKTPDIAARQRAMSLSPTEWSRRA